MENPNQEPETHLFAEQKKIYPQAVRGRYRKLKWWITMVLLGIFYLSPWLRWDRGGNAPNQAILIDMMHARAYFFGIEIWSQEVYYITGILILAAVGLFFVTSLFGRVWCGYACPQTVWTDLFVLVERKIQGDRNSRKRLDASPLSLEKITKKALTHFIWLVIGLATGVAFVLYFNDAPSLARQMLQLDIPWSVGGWILGITASTYIMAGFAREQVCIYMCPYARFQSAMFDKDTLIISYDEKRGEPRGKHKAGDSWTEKGHCIDCNSCVVVCPMGIDIRNGLQMECITCGLCVDACNGVMDKIGLPRGLIGYNTENALTNSEKPKLQFFRPRTFWYVGIMSAVGGFMLYTLLTRLPLKLDVIHDRNPLFVKLSDGRIRDGYTITILNKEHEQRKYELEILGLADAETRVESNRDVSKDDLEVAADSVGHFRIFVTAPEQKEAHEDIKFLLTEETSKLHDEKETIFVSESK